MSGVREAINKNSGEGVESKGLKAHFYMEESGIIKLTHAEAVFEKLIDNSNDTKDEESTLSKLGSTISKLFSGIFDMIIINQVLGDRQDTLINIIFFSICFFRLQFLNLKIFFL